MRIWRRLQADPEPRGNDGLGRVQVHMTNTSNLPIEALEMEFPLLIVHKYGLIENSGGARRRIQGRTGNRADF